MEDLRHAHQFGNFQLDPDLAKAFEAIKGGMFGDAGRFSALCDSIIDHGDYYLVSDDFNSYVKTQALIDEAFKNQDEWIEKTIVSVSRMGFFSSDRCIQEYADGMCINKLLSLHLFPRLWFRFVLPSTSDYADSGISPIRQVFGTSNL